MGINQSDIGQMPQTFSCQALAQVVVFFLQKMIDYKLPLHRI